MSTLTLLWISNAIQFAILWRAVRTSALPKYPYFHLYIASTLSSVALPFVYMFDRAGYNNWYWPIQFATLVFGCGVIVEIFQHVLSPYPGAARFAKFTAFVAFGALFCVAISYMAFHAQSSYAATGIELERNVRAVQAILLFAILIIIFRYRIPIGKNILGMMLGYGVYIGVSLISRAIEAYAGAWLRYVWLYVQPLSFEVALAIWLVALWSYNPNPAPDPAVPVEMDYELLASRTRRALSATRSYLGRATRV